MDLLPLTGFVFNSSFSTRLRRAVEDFGMIWYK
jgi:hypothetical protein